ncbi:MAG TPA: hypothetical protein PLB36_00830 [Bacillota bacterium]|nr:hypothetical protein [Candidatus Fermentithermobacillaceae bacterium]HOB30167.1 hypothetical protein [Bacillota bacterium]HOK64057.1 hypothetical protein [Bacillota bacterium]HOL11412.1 hypothetical protein [Bacillota bacterium]HOQ02541.1 hypothetical protein [Bacillota bacterium]
MKLAAYGFLPTGFAVIISFSLAKWGFKNLYYVSQLLPLFMVFYLTLAWFIHLRQTSFLVSPRQTRKPVDALGHHEPDMARQLPEDKSSGEELLHVRDEHGLIFREQSTDAIQDAEKRRREFSPDAAQTTIKILLWSACQIGLLATILYHWLGIGSVFY